MLFLRNYPVNVLRYLPDFLAEDKAFKKVQDGLSKEHEGLRLELDELSNQLFIQTATKQGIESWERIIGLIPRAGDDLEARRRAILLWLQSNQVSTVEFMRMLAARYYPDNADVSIEEHNEEYYFTILAKNLASDWYGLLDAVEIYKPAHLGYGIRSDIDVICSLWLGIATGVCKQYHIMQVFAGNEHINTDIKKGLAVGLAKQQDLLPMAVTNENINSNLLMATASGLRKQQTTIPVMVANEDIKARLFMATASGLQKHHDAMPQSASDAVVKVRYLNGFGPSIYKHIDAGKQSVVTKEEK